MLGLSFFIFYFFSCLYIKCTRSSGSAGFIKKKWGCFFLTSENVLIFLCLKYKRIIMQYNSDFCNLKKMGTDKDKLQNSKWVKRWLDSSEVMCQLCEILNNTNLFISWKSQRSSKKPCTIITWPPLWRKTIIQQESRKK